MCGCEGVCVSGGGVCVRVRGGCVCVCVVKSEGMEEVCGCVYNACL